MRLLILMLALGALSVAGQADDARPGLTVIDGRIHRAGRPYRAFGVNYCDLFEELIHDPLSERTLDGLRLLGEKGIPYVRFWSCGFWPSDWDLYFEDKDEWFRRMDLIVNTAEEANVGLIPSVFWRIATYPDIFDEYADAWGDPDSQTQQFMRAYVGEVVERYKDSPAIWGWEFANEVNLGCDLPNGMEFLGQVIPHLKVDLEKHERNLLTYEAADVAFRGFAEEVRKRDETRFITTGNSEPRPYAYHNRTEKSWDADSLEEAREVYTWMNPEPMNVVSMHFYPTPGEAPVYAGAEGIAEVLALNASLAREIGMPLFVGEFAASASDKGGALSMDEFKAIQTEILDGIVASGADLAAHWVFDYSANIEGPGLIRAENEYAWILDQLVEYNEKLAAEDNPR